jgi:photosystem II stability/assembly factor-like uncharacterized protein
MTERGVHKATIERGPARAIAMIGSRARWSVIVCAGTLAACGSTGHLRSVLSHARASRPSPESRCDRPAPLAAGAVIGGWRLGAIHFVSSNVGVALTASSIPCAVSVTGGVEVNFRKQPVLLAISHDGGRRWVTDGTALPTPAVVWSENLAATSPGQIWASTGSGRLWATTLGGAKWIAQPLPGPVLQLAMSGRYLWALACPSTSSVHCRPVLERRRLAHGSWARLPFPDLVSAPTTELVAPSDDVVVVHLAPFPDTLGELVSSTDAGLQWRRQPIPSRVDGPRLGCGDLTAANSRDWWLLCSLGGGTNHSANALRRTTDGGHTWTIVSAERHPFGPVPPGAIPAVNPGSLAAGSPRRLWLTNSVGGLAESSDGGATWTTVPLNTDGAFTSFDVLSATQAWVLAIGQGLWRTTDGSHWQALGHPYLGP